MSTKLSLAAFFVAAVGLASQATAAPFTTYSSRASWETAAGSFDNYGFDPAPLTSFPLSGGTIDAGDFSVTVDRQHGVEPGFTAFDTLDGHTYFRTDLHAPGFFSPSFYSFTFDRPIRAFAVDLGGVGDDDIRRCESFPADCYGIMVTINGLNFTLPYLNGSQFFGISTDFAFNSILFTKPRGEQDYHSLFNPSYQFVTEPSAIGLLGLGLAGLAFTRRRKQ